MRYWRKWIGLAICIAAIGQAYAQGTLRGKIADANGEVLIGVSVFIKEDPTKGTSSDLDGYYSLDITSDKLYTLVLSYVSYETISDTFQLRKNEVRVKDFVMGTSAVNLGEVEVVAKQERRNQYYMESIKRKSASTLDFMSGELMNKIGDNNVSAAISRVTGVTTNGNFISVRGLGDRYVQTCINGSLIPTLDPFTNNIQLDLFPASFVDNIVITKTSSAEIQGDWSAAYISIETKDIPDKLSIAIETKIGFNPQYSFKKIIANPVSSTDWLGFDNGFRNIDHQKFTPVVTSPTTYEEFCALGLKSYFNSIGVTESWSPGSQIGDVYFKLGLIELGLLGKANIHNDQAFNEAKDLYYAGTYQNDAYTLINAEGERSLDLFANNWNTFEKTAPLIFSQSFSVGNQSRVFGKPLSFIGGFRYGNGIQYDPVSTFSRTPSAAVDSSGGPLVEQHYDQAIAKYTNGWTGLLSTTYKWNTNHSVSLLFMPNLTGINSIRKGVDQLRSTLYQYAFLQGQFYEERSQYIYQYASDHYFPNAALKLHLSASYTDGQSSAPDFKSLQYFSDDLIQYRLDRTISNVRRNFRYLDEDILDTKVCAELPLHQTPGNVSKLKAGLSFQDKQREFTQYDYLLQLASGVGFNFSNEDLNELFSNEKFDIRPEPINGNSRIDIYYRKYNDPGNHTIGHSLVYAAFAMVDETLSPSLRVSGGLRAEYADIFSDVKLFSDLGYEADDLRRRTPEQSFVLTPSKFHQLDLLPSVNVIYRLRKDEIFPSNLRMNYSRSVARPSIREYTETVVRDFELNADVFGNADLKFVQINNFDVRYENYFTSGDYVSLSLFYKSFKNHIELISSNIGFTWSNADQSSVYGIELEGRIALDEHFEFRSNVSLVHSHTRVNDQRLRVENGVKSWDVVGVIERTMFGQAPYVINALINYTGRHGLGATLSYNVQGAKLVLTSIDLAPDIFELPRHLVNMRISQKLGSHFALSLAAQDLFNTPRRRAYQFESGYLLDFDRYQYGREFSFGISYTL